MAEKSEPAQSLELDLIAASYRAIGDPLTVEEIVLRMQDLFDATPEDQPQTGFLAQHVGAFKAMLRALPPVEQRGGIGRQIADANGAALVMSGGGRILNANSLANEEFGAVVGGAFDTGLLRIEAQEAFEKLSDACSPGELGLNEAESDAPAPVAMLPFTTKQGRYSVAMAALAESEDSDERVIVLKNISVGWSDQVSGFLADQFELTAAQIEVTRALYDNADVDTVAAVRGTSVATIRKQLREIYAKTDSSGQVELVRLVGSLCAQFSQAGTPTLNYRDPYGRQKIVNVEGRGPLAYSWFGREGGKPAILTHGLSTGYMLRETIVSALEQADIQVFAPQRPLFGNTVWEEGDSAMSDGADAIAALMDHLAIERAPLIGISYGMLPNLAYAKRRPERVCGVYNLCSVAPLDTAKHRAHLPSNQRSMLNSAARALEFLELAGRFLIRALMEHGPEYFLDIMYAGAPEDRDLNARPDIKALRIAGVELFAAQDHRAFVRDQQMFVESFEDDLAALSCPVGMLAGVRDILAPIGAVRELADRCPNLEVTEVEGAGQSLFNSHPEAVIAALREWIGDGPRALRIAR